MYLFWFFVFLDVVFKPYCHCKSLHVFITFTKYFNTPKQKFTISITTTIQFLLHNLHPITHHIFTIITTRKSINHRGFHSTRKPTTQFISNKYFGTFAAPLNFVLITFYLYLFYRSTFGGEIGFPG